MHYTALKFSKQYAFYHFMHLHYIQTQNNLKEIIKFCSNYIYFVFENKIQNFYFKLDFSFILMNLSQ